MQRIAEVNNLQESLTWQKLIRYVNGEISLAEMEGLSEEQLYTIAEIGYVLMENGKLEDAMKIYEGLVEMSPEDAYFHSVLGAIYQRMNEYEKSLAEYDTAIRLNPGDIPSLVNSAEVLLHKGELIKSSERLKAAISMDSKGENPWALRARALVSVIGNILKEKTT